MSLRRMAIAAVILVAVIGLGLSLGLPALKRPAPESKTVMLAVATAQPADLAAQASTLVSDAAPVEEVKAEAKPAPKRKAPKAKQPSVEDIPF